MGAPTPRSRLLGTGLLLGLLSSYACTCTPPTDPLLFESAGDRPSLKVSLSPLDLQLQRFGTTVQGIAPFFSVGTLAEQDSSHYYDPSYDDGVVYTEHASAGDFSREGDTLRLSLTLDGRPYTLTLQPAVEGAYAFSLVAEGNTRDVLHTRIKLAGKAGTRVYGLGEYFDSPEHHGRTRSLRFDLDNSTDAGDNQTHVRVPNLVRSDGFGLLLDNTEPLLAEIGEDGSATLTVVSDHLSGYLLLEQDPLRTLAAEQRLAGLPPLWPAWAFAPQLWRNEVPVICSIACADGCAPSSTGQDLVLGDAQAMRDLKLPGSVMWVDAPWESSFNSFEFNDLQFQDAGAMIARLRALGFRTVVWAAPFVNKADDSATECGMLGAGAGGLFAEAEAKGYLLGDDRGRPFLLPWRGTAGALVDFTNPAAFDWWKRLVHRAVDLGVSGFKLDFDEYVNPGLGPISLEDTLVPFDGSTLTSLHGRYSALFHQAHFEVLQEASDVAAGVAPDPAPGDPHASHAPIDGFIIARTGNAHDAAYATAIWPGDMCNGFQRFAQVDSPGAKAHAGGLPAVLQAGISLAASLHPHFASDIGGYRHGAPASDALFIRWMQYGALSTVMQFGGGGNNHNPWDSALYGPAVLDAYRQYGGLHLRLNPLIHAYAAQNARDGTPIVRPLGLAYPGDLAAADAPDEFLLGPDLLVAPVVTEAATQRSVTFPAGRWVQWWDDRVIEGPVTLPAEPAPLDVLPLYVRAGGLVPMLAPEVVTMVPTDEPGIIDASDRAESLWVRAYPGEAQNTLCLVEGSCLSASLEGGRYLLDWSKAPAPRSLTLRIAWQLIAYTEPGLIALSGSTLTRHSDQASFDAAAEGTYYDTQRGVLWIRTPAQLSGRVSVSY